MKDSSLIRESYTRVEKHFSEDIDYAVKDEDYRLHVALMRQFRISEYAFFVLFWGQFETLINEMAYEIEGDQSEKLDFMPRVRLVISPHRDYYEMVDQYYKWRCKLAHGDISDLP